MIYEDKDETCEQNSHIDCFQHVRCCTNELLICFHFNQGVHRTRTTQCQESSRRALMI